MQARTCRPKLRDARVGSALEGSSVSSPKKRSTRFSHDAYMGGEVDPRMTEQPPMHRRGFVRREIVQDDVQVQLGLHARVERAQKRDEVLGDFCRGDVQPARAVGNFRE
jgi:hypothetical protein